MTTLKILFILGPNRSGSTLVSRVLNEFAGVTAVGEVVSLDLAFQSSRAQGLARDATSATPEEAWNGATSRFSGLCGCGLAVQDCPIWGRVETAVFGDPPDYSRWSWDTSRPSVAQLLLRGTRGWREHRSAEHGRFIEMVYRQLAELTEAKVLVDDSKSPMYGYFLAQQPWADVVPVRLVRDPRATAASWSRVKRYRGMASEGLPAHSAAIAAVSWLKRVLAADRLFGGCPVVRYEDFVDDPVGSSKRLLDPFGGAAEPLVGGDTGRTLTFGTNHIIAGNPDKFERGEVEIRAPSDPTHALRPGTRALVTAATLPLLSRHGYRVW
jgi:hypothetical protein